MTDFEKQLQNYRLTTAEIIYHLPDYPELLQSFIWQQLDIAPEFPILTSFLDYWIEHIEGRLHTVKVANCELIRPAEFTYADGLFTLQ